MLNRSSSFFTYASFLIAASFAATQAVSGQQFTSSTNLTPGSQDIPRVLGTADFNLDGKPDALESVYISSSNTFSFALLLNQGGGKFNRKVLTDVPTVATRSTALPGDVNGDGKPDIVVVNSSDGSDPKNPLGNSTIVVYLGNGDGTFHALPPVTIGGLPSTIALLKDLNNDGSLDVITDSPDYGSQTDAFQVFLNDGHGVFTAGELVAPATGTHLLLGSGRFYNHVSTDLVIVTDSGLQILKNDGHGVFSGGVAFNVGNVTIGDYNGDGYDDLLTTAFNPPNGNGSSAVMLNNGDGTFHQSSVLDTSYFMTDGFESPGYVADFNHDGHKDIAYFSINNQFESIVGIFPGNGDGTFKYPTLYNLGTRTSSFAFANFNGAGSLELLTTSNQFELLTRADRHGSLIGPRISLSPGAISLASGDINLDGKPDFAAVAESLCTTCNAQVDIFPGTEQGFLARKKSYPIGQLSGVIAIGDVNGDGQPDLVVARSRGVDSSKPPGNFDLSVLLADGSGDFKPAMNFKLLGPAATGTISTSIFLVDANNDGKLDLVGDWGVALGNGDGTFQAPKSLPAGITNIVAVAEGDFNHDGRVDLEVGTSGTPPAYLYTLLGAGDGTFVIANKSEVGGATNSYLSGLVTADINKDGIVDLIYGASTYVNGISSTDLCVQQGNGDGTFAAANIYPVENLPSYLGTIAVGDFNRDGQLDVLLADTDSADQGSVTLLYGTGGGNLSSTRQYSQGAISFLTPTSLNADTAPDVAGIVRGVGIERLLNSGAH